MSGIELALAVPGLVFGAVQAYDAALRVVENLRDKRRARQAPPPTVVLEKSLQKGSQEIKEALVSGVDRFGPQFAQGDDTLNIALLQIENQIQRALLDKLAAATDDDNFNDFGELIDISDRSNRIAVIAIHQYFLRKQAEERQSKQAIVVETPVRSASIALPVTTSVVVSDPISTQTSPSVSPRNKTAESRWRRPFGPSSRRTTEPTRASTEYNHETGHAALQTPVKDRRRARPVDQDSKDNHSRTSIASNGHTGGGLYTSFPLLSTENARVHSTKHGSSITTTTAERRSSSTTSLSTQSHGGISIPTNGGCCESAHLIRDGSSKGLMLRDISSWGCKSKDMKFLYACKINGCNFNLPATRNAKNNWILDDKTRLQSGIEYRCSFLAKSHITQTHQTQDSSIAQARAPYRCLICVYLNDVHAVYLGPQSLMAHVKTHAGAILGVTRLEGPLVFSNQGVTVSADFDVNFPEVEMDPPTPSIISSDTFLGTTRSGNVPSETSSHWSDSLVENVWEER